MVEAYAPLGYVPSEEEKEEEEEWIKAQIIFGTLKEINRAESSILIEYKNEMDEWVTDRYSISS